MIHFQTLPNSFEVFGVDWIVSTSPPQHHGTNANDDIDIDIDVHGNVNVNVYLLEVNAFPDFKQSGAEMRDVVAGLWEAVVRLGVVPFFRGDRDHDDNDNDGGGDGGGDGGMGLDDEEGKAAEKGEGDDGKGGKMVKVLDIDLGRR